ncbi:MAG: hypothetical protein H0T09_05525 [Actinobacteria bacterium]|nr:hypothetical protein [Actinomycetota bacterium]
MGNFARSALVLAVAAALVGAGAAYSAKPAGGPADHEHGVGGGRFGPACSTGGFCFAAPRDFSVDAHSSKEKEVYGQLLYGDSDAGVAIAQIDVTCMRADGNRAVVAGIIREHRDPTFADGTWGAAFYVVDNGPPGGAARDQASPLLVDRIGAPGLEGMPAECPPLDNDAFGFGFLTLHSGDVVVRPEAVLTG